MKNNLIERGEGMGVYSSKREWEGGPYISEWGRGSYIKRGIL